MNEQIWYEFQEILELEKEESVISKRAKDIKALFEKYRQETCGNSVDGAFEWFSKIEEANKTITKESTYIRYKSLRSIPIWKQFKEVFCNADMKLTNKEKEVALRELRGFVFSYASHSYEGYYGDCQEKWANNNQQPKWKVLMQTDDVKEQRKLYYSGLCYNYGILPYAEDGSDCAETAWLNYWKERPPIRYIQYGREIVPIDDREMIRMVPNIKEELDCLCDIEDFISTINPTEVQAQQ